MGPDTVVWEEDMGQAWGWEWVWAVWALWGPLVSVQTPPRNASSITYAFACGSVERAWRRHHVFVPNQTVDLRLPLLLDLQQCIVTQHE